MGTPVESESVRLEPMMFPRGNPVVARMKGDNSESIPLSALQRNIPDTSPSRRFQNQVSPLRQKHESLDRRAVCRKRREETGTRRAAQRAEGTTQAGPRQEDSRWTIEAGDEGNSAEACTAGGRLSAVRATHVQNSEEQRQLPGNRARALSFRRRSRPLFHGLGSYRRRSSRDMRPVRGWKAQQDLAVPWVWVFLRAGVGDLVRSCGQTGARGRGEMDIDNLTRQNMSEWIK